MIVSMAVAGGAIARAVFGGWVNLNHRLGRRTTILIADFMFFIGVVIMAVANGSPPLPIVGRIFVGMASITSPLYISEASPAKVRGALVGLVSINGFLMTGCHFLPYLTNLTFAKVIQLLYVVVTLKAGVLRYS